MSLCHSDVRCSAQMLKLQIQIPSQISQVCSVLKIMCQDGWVVNTLCVEYETDDRQWSKMYKTSMHWQDSYIFAHSIQCTLNCVANGMC